MAMKSGMNLVQRQGIALSPMMRQSLSILRMPTHALADEIAREAEENPFLVVEPQGGTTAAYDHALATTAAPENLLDNLHRQIAMQRLDPATEAAALYLIGELREDGYLDMALGDLAGETGAPLDVLEAGLDALQRCEPTGIGARNLSECLELQLAEAGIDRSLAHAATQHLGDFAEANWAKLGRTLGQAPEVLERIAALLRGFGSTPITDASSPIDVVIPELVVEAGPQGKVTVTLLTGALPRLSTMDVSRRSLETEEQRSLFDRAGRMSEGLTARRDTVLRIGTYIAATQSAFFLGQHETLTPVTRADAASALAMHASTLGRALAGKALLADNKVYPLSLFFSRAIPGADGAISPFDIQRRIRALIGGESADAPLADEKICEVLRKEGVDIARRTVAKYRKCMRIPSSFGRRRRKVSETDRPQTVLRGK
ncbi:RNA polymerase factor sigma-54 [Defluviimonas sp. SAOS-178_SWC]|uniref:RNA polymerase factor sigma-54 n=1 Tax=Defluviimonas sp. SAOS-178_SWC TaxID=3121287 RepID=UPI003222195C